MITKIKQKMKKSVYKSGMLLFIALLIVSFTLISGGSYKGIS